MQSQNSEVDSNRWHSSCSTCLITRKVYSPSGGMLAGPRQQGPGAAAASSAVRAHAPMGLGGHTRLRRGTVRRWIARRAQGAPAEHAGAGRSGAAASQAMQGASTFAPSVPGVPRCGKGQGGVEMWGGAE